MSESVCLICALWLLPTLLAGSDQRLASCLWSYGIVPTNLFSGDTFPRGLEYVGSTGLERVKHHYAIHHKDTNKFTEVHQWEIKQWTNRTRTDQLHRKVNTTVDN